MLRIENPGDVPRYKDGCVTVAFELSQLKFHVRQSRRAILKLRSGTDDMITVGMNYHVLPGKQKDFEDKFAGVIDALKAAPVHTSSTLWKDVTDDA